MFKEILKSKPAVSSTTISAYTNKEPQDDNDRISPANQSSEELKSSCSSTAASKPVRELKALCDNIVNRQGELSFKKGQPVIHLYFIDDIWSFGRMKKGGQLVQGKFPSSCLGPCNHIMNDVVKPNNISKRANEKNRIKVKPIRAVCDNITTALGEISFKRGQEIVVLFHIDDIWTVGKIKKGKKVLKGRFPTSCLGVEVMGTQIIRAQYNTGKDVQGNELISTNISSSSSASSISIHNVQDEQDILDTSKNAKNPDERSIETLGNSDKEWMYESDNDRCLDDSVVGVKVKPLPPPQSDAVRERRSSLSSQKSNKEDDSAVGVKVKPLPPPQSDAVRERRSSLSSQNSNKEDDSAVGVKVKPLPPPQSDAVRERRSSLSSQNNNREEDNLSDKIKVKSLMKFSTNTSSTSVDASDIPTIQVESSNIVEHDNILLDIKARPFTSTEKTSYDVDSEFRENVAKMKIQDKHNANIECLNTYDKKSEVTVDLCQDDLVLYPSERLEHQKKDEETMKNAEPRVDIQAEVEMSLELENTKVLERSCTLDVEISLAKTALSTDTLPDDMKVSSNPPLSPRPRSLQKQEKAHLSVSDTDMEFINSIGDNTFLSPLVRRSSQDDSDSDTLPRLQKSPLALTKSCGDMSSGADSLKLKSCVRTRGTQRTDLKVTFGWVDYECDHLERLEAQAKLNEDIKKAEEDAKCAAVAAKEKNERLSAVEDQEASAIATLQLKQQKLQQLQDRIRKTKAAII